MNFTLPDLYQTPVAPSLDLPWEQDIIALRRDFHAHPELGFEEVRTAEIVAQRLRTLGLEVHIGIGVTGVVGILRGAKPGPTVLVRADMDALPVEEENDWPWKSTIPGKMHACGHDAHTAGALTVARLLSAQKDELAGTVKFMFQPAEEGGGGALKMIEDGLLEDGKFGPRPDIALAMHMWGSQDYGKIGACTGPILAANGSFVARIIGRGGHGAMPNQTIDAIVVACHVTLALQTIVSRNVIPLEPAVVTVGSMLAGTGGGGAVPSEVTLKGSFRSYDAEVWELVARRCREIVEQLPLAFGATGEFSYKRGYPVLRNDDAITELVQGVAAAVVPAADIVPFRTMGSEDMAFVMNEIPGCYFWIGAGNAEIDAVYPHHHPKFNFDERALVDGVRIMVEAVKECLNR